MPIFLILFLLFCLWFTYERKKSSKASKKESESFWERERSSGYVPKKDVGDVRFITVPEDIIPDCPELCSEAEVLRRLSSERSADLSSFSNTDLRLKYGTSNFESLSAADANYGELTKALGSCAMSLAESGRTEESLRIIKFAEDNDILTGDILCAKAVMCTATEDISGIEDLIDQALSDSRIGASGPYVADRLRAILNNMLKQ